MKALNRDAIINIVKKSGIADKKIDKIIGTLRISLARQAAKRAERSIILDESTVLELEESLRIGAGITPLEAKEILIKVEDTIKIQDEAKVKFLEEGTFEVNEGVLKFKLTE